MNVRHGIRGRPLLALIILFGGWIGLRVMVLGSTAIAPVSAAVEVVPGKEGPPMASVAGAVPPPSGHGGVGLPGGSAALASGPGEPAWRGAPALRDPAGLLPMTSAPIALVQPAPQQFAGKAGGGARPGQPSTASSSPLHAVQSSVRIAAARQMLWMAVRRSFSTVGIAAPMDRSPAPPMSSPAPVRRAESRWSGDGWMLLRRGGNVSLASGPAPATYGASQAGAVVRYRLSTDGRHRASIYGRGTAALNGSGEREAAIGLSARPIAGLPVVAAAELRATALPGGTRLRPAATAYTQLPPIKLPRGMRGEAYAQAGYVGGRYSTPFVDGQVRVDREVARIGKGGIRAGVGAWGGAQEGASRLDIGPAAVMAMGIGAEVSARLAVDWRFRVAGNAEPASGPAVTLSAGF